MKIGEVSADIEMKDVGGEDDESGEEEVDVERKVSVPKGKGKGKAKVCVEPLLGTHAHP